MNESAETVVAMTGSTGFVGKRLVERFRQADYTLLPLGRKDFSGTEEQLARQLRGVKVIVNLAGAPVIARWTKAYKKIMYDSRVSLTNKLVAAIALLETPPEAFISTSAVGIYESEGIHAETASVPADTSLGRLAYAWEKEALKAEHLGCRVVIFRLGVVIGPGGGALAKMLPAFRYGLGGTIGNGRQAFSWVHIDDLLKAYETAVADQSYTGVYNLAAPNPTTNKGLTRVLGKVLSRPTILPLPSFVLRLFFGEGAQVLTSGQSAYPKRLLDAGFSFQYENIDAAVSACM